MAVDGLITLRSSFGPTETMSRFQAEVRAGGMTIFYEIDHAAGAAAVGMALRLLSYNDPAYVVDRHRLGKAVESAIDATSTALKGMAEKSTAR
jgi:hypothetical protein